MSASAPRTKTPAVEPNRTKDSTEPELAPPIRPSPLGPQLPPPDPARARRQTLVSPIPALLAASMGEVRDEPEATPTPVDVRSDATSRLDDTDQQRLLMDDDADYIVEVDDGKPRH